MIKKVNKCKCENINGVEACMNCGLQYQVNMLDEGHMNHLLKKKYVLKQYNNKNNKCKFFNSLTEYGMPTINISYSDKQLFCDYYGYILKQLGVKFLNKPNKNFVLMVIMTLYFNKTIKQAYMLLPYI